MLWLNKEYGIGRAKLPIWLWLVLGVVALAVITVFHRTYQGNSDVYELKDNDYEKIERLTDIVFEPVTPKSTPKPTPTPTSDTLDANNTDYRFVQAMRPMPKGSMSIFNPYDPLTELVTRASLSYGDTSPEAEELRQRAKFELTNAIWFKSRQNISR